MHFPRFKRKQQIWKTTYSILLPASDCNLCVWSQEPPEWISPMLVWYWSLSNGPVCLLPCDTKLQVSARGLLGKAAPQQSFKLVTYYCYHHFHYSHYCATISSLLGAAPWISCVHGHFCPCKWMQNVDFWFAHILNLFALSFCSWGTAHRATACKSRAMCSGGSHLRLIFFPCGC